MSDTLPEYNKELADLYTSKRVQFADSAVGSKEAALLLVEIEQISAQLFGFEVIPEPITNPNLINSISVWLVSDMIKAVFYADYSSIGIGTEDEIDKAFSNLISQYHEACKNEWVKTYVQLTAKIKAIELQWAIINSIADVMTTRYNELGAARLRELYPAYEFTPESLLSDLNKIGVGEIATKRKYDLYTEQLEKMNAGKDGKKNETPLDRHSNFLARLAEINKYEGTRYRPEETTVLELAVLENRLSEHYERELEKAHKHGSGN